VKKGRYGLADREERNMERKIVTRFEHPPIPIRTMDWLAIYDGEEEGAEGWGATEAEAIADLKGQDDE